MRMLWMMCLLGLYAIQVDAMGPAFRFCGRCFGGSIVGTTTYVANTLAGAYLHKQYKSGATDQNGTMQSIYDFTRRHGVNQEDTNAGLIIGVGTLINRWVVGRAAATFALPFYASQFATYHMINRYVTPESLSSLVDYMAKLRQGVNTTPSSDNSHDAHNAQANTQEAHENNAEVGAIEDVFKRFESWNESIKRSNSQNFWTILGGIITMR